jgi:CRP/FNR family transcriptional regulator, cyclic AMP receptor protein
VTERGLLASLPAEERDLLLRGDRRRRFARGEVVFHAGDPADTLHLIVAGRLAVRTRTPDGYEAILTVAAPGQSVGELALMGQEPFRSATVTALTAAETIALSRADLERLRAGYPLVDRLLFTALSGQIKRLSSTLVETLFIPARTRVVRRLVVLLEQFDNGVIEMTQDDIALFAGTTRSTVNETLQELARQRVVIVGRGRVQVVDPAGLVRKGR